MKRLKRSLKTGLAFGLTSGTVTTVGLMVGLSAGTHSRLVFVGGVITIAVADAFSDALGIHVSEESLNQQSEREIWLATLATFLAKFFCALSFLIPLALFPLESAIWAGVFWGGILLALFSHWIARSQQKRSLPVIAEHLGVAAVVVVLTYYLGNWVSTWSK